VLPVVEVFEVFELLFLLHAEVKTHVATATQYHNFVFINFNPGIIGCNSYNQNIKRFSKYW